MKFHVVSDPAYHVAADVLILPVFEDETTATHDLALIDEAAGGVLGQVIGTDEMKGKPGQFALVRVPAGLGARRVLLAGAGKPESFTSGAMRKLIGAAVRGHGRKGVAGMAFVARPTAAASAELGQAAAEGALIAAFAVDSYRTEDRDPVTAESLTVIAPETEVAAFQSGLERGQIIGESVNVTRHLVNEPGNVITPTRLAHHAQEVANETGLAVEIINEDRMRDLGMGALLAVARGSVEEPALIVLRYTAANPTDATDTLALVGKGITFDTGGISLKPAEGMEKMKYDMAGGAAVIGAMRAIALLKPNVNVIGLVPTCENMPSGRATKPGDIAKSMLGKTIEIINTDAEGRLILCDALAYARDLGATRIVDLATLTGAISVALGTTYCGLFTSNQPHADAVIAAARNADEKVWQMPLDAEYRDLIKSDIADLKNTGGRYGGSITAAYFLREFVGDTPWVHLDIAGVGWNLENKPHLPKGPSGFGVRTLVAFACGKE